MKPALLLAAVALTACTPEPASESNPLVGAWELVEYSDTPEGGAPVHAFGEHPTGLFVFTPEGQASISFMRNPPENEAATQDPDPDACIPAWYCSYFGTYAYDPAASSWTVHVEGGNIPSFIGTDQVRRFTISGDTLTIADTYEVEGVSYHARRVLRRRGG